MIARRAPGPFWILALAGCAGPDRGTVGELRGRSQVLRDLEDASFEHRLADAAGERPASARERAEVAGEPGEAPAAGGRETSAAFPLFYRETGSRPVGAAVEETSFLEVLWPLFEAGHGRIRDPGGGLVGASDGGGAGAGAGRALDAPPARSSYFRLRPFLAADSFRRSSRRVLFPFYFHVREELEAGTREVDHFWPFFGIHREPIDLAPATTRHVLYPLFYWRTGPDRWKLSILPLAALSRGYLDRGIWLIPAVKWGEHGRSRFFYFLDPLFAFESLSIARGPEDDVPGKRRTRVLLLGGLLGWERDRGAARLRLLWWIKV